MSVLNDLLFKMRKDRLYVFGSLTLFVWISMTYFLFVHRPNSEAVRRRLGLEDRSTLTIASLSARINDFEIELKRTSDENSALLQALREAVKESHSVEKLKKKAEKTVPDKKNAEKPIEINAGSTSDVVIAVLMFACNRVTVRKALDSLLAYRKDKVKFPIIVSQVYTYYVLQSVLM